MAKKKKSSTSSKQTAGRKKVENSSKLSIKDRLIAYWNDRSPALRFFASFGGCMALFYAFYFSQFNADYVHKHITSAQASIGAWLVNLFGTGASSSGETISGDGFAVSVSGGCDGLEVTALLVSAIIAFPASWPSKFKGLLGGVALLTVLNIFRLPVLFFAGKNGSQALFDLLHVQGGFIVFVTITILIFAYWVSNVIAKGELQTKPASH